METTAVIFDFDGTLAELNIDFREMKAGILRLAASFGIEGLGPDGAPSLELMGEIAGRLQPPEREEFLARGHGLIEGMEMAAAQRGGLFPYTRGLLQDLSNMGIATAIITRNLGKAVALVFPDIDSHVGAFVPREKAENLKPHPAHLLDAISRVGAAVEGSLYVGDHPIDIETGKRAGVKTCAVLTGRITREEFEKLGPDYILRDCRGVLDLLGR